MISFEIFLLGLLIVSTLTGLTTEAIKKVREERNREYKANTLAGLVSLFISTMVGVCYVIIADIAFTANVGVYLVALIFLSWLCAMVGYDKVVQAISQFKTNRED